ncbi:MAG: polysaccharide deacetylase family protein [Planctomycetota bacterium]|jgi:peptidoglycan/xylan/chitin deacetylase (PgdA/CDA1 family)
MARRLAQRVVHCRAGDRLLRVLEEAESRRPNLLRVLTYHRVTEPSAFEQQVEHLVSHYNVAPLSAVLDAVTRRRPLPARSVMITFDDGYREVGELAWPILRRLGAPAVLFVPTAYPDRPRQTFWWDRLEQALDDTPRRDELETPIGRLPLARAPDRARACSRLKRYLTTLHHDDARRRAEMICRVLDAPPGPVPDVLGWGDLRRLAREGLAIGAHSRTHPLLNRLPAAAARAEVLGGQEDLRRELGEALPVFCYPHGRWGPAVLDALREAGIAAAFTTRRGTNDLRTADPLQLRRINVSRAAGLPVLRARLIHSSVYLNRWRWIFDTQPALNGRRQRRRLRPGSGDHA